MRAKKISVSIEKDTPLETLREYFHVSKALSETQAALSISELIFPQIEAGKRLIFIDVQNMWITFGLMQALCNSILPAFLVILNPRKDGKTFDCLMTPGIQIARAIEMFGDTFLMRDKYVYHLDMHLPSIDMDWWTRTHRFCLNLIAARTRKDIKMEKVDVPPREIRDTVRLSGCKTEHIVFWLHPNALSNIEKMTRKNVLDDSMSWPSNTPQEESSHFSTVPSERYESDFENEDSCKSCVSSKKPMEEEEKAPLVIPSDERLHMNVARNGDMTSITCLERMYKESRPNVPQRALWGCAIKPHHNIYVYDEKGQKVMTKKGPQVETSAYVLAKRDVVDRDCAMFSFDAGLKHEDPDVQKKLEFSKKYFTGGYDQLYMLFLRGGPQFYRRDRELGTYEDVGLHRCCYESLMFWRRSKFFIDCEMSLKFNEADGKHVERMMDALISFVMEMAKKLCNVKLEYSDWLVLCSDSEIKISRHIICLNPAFAFANVLALDWFYVMCFEELSQRFSDGDENAKILRVRDKNYAYIWFWDGCTTKEFQLFRVFGADKFKANRPLRYEESLNYTSLGGYAKEWRQMKVRERFLNSLIQYPWKGEMDNDSEVNFTIFPGARIGRFTCVFQGDDMIGFETHTRRRSGNGVLRTKKMIMSSSASVTPESVQKIEEWMKASIRFKEWHGYAIDTARYKLLTGEMKNYRTLMVEFKGAGEDCPVFCYRRAKNVGYNPQRAILSAISGFDDDGSGDINEPDAKRRKKSGPTHSNAPVLLFFGWDNKFRKFVVTQTCNKPECGKFGHQFITEMPPEFISLLKID